MHNLILTLFLVVLGAIVPERVFDSDWNTLLEKIRINWLSKVEDTYEPYLRAIGSHHR